MPALQHGNYALDNALMHTSGVPVYCADFQCSHSVVLGADQWPDDVRLSEVKPRFVCHSSGHRGADVRPDFNWDKETAWKVRVRFPTHRQWLPLYPRKLPRMHCLRSWLS